MAVIYARDNQLHGRGVNLAVISIVFTFVAVCLVASRLASRITTGRKLHEDDYAIIASVVRLVPEQSPSRLDVPVDCDLADPMPQVFSIGLGISNVVSEYSSSIPTCLLSRPVHRTEQCIGVAHGAGKVSTSLPPEDVRVALQVNQDQAEAALIPGATFSRSFSDILGSSDLVQIHNHPDKDLDLSPLPAHLHDQEISSNGAHYHGLRGTVRFRKHYSNHRTVHAARAHLGS